MNIKIDLYNEDCLQVLKSISPKSIDLIFCDLPYCGMTNTKKDSEVACKWNTPVDLEILWKLFKRIRKPTTPIFFCCSTKFGYSLIKANEKEFRYDLVWIKSAPTNFLNSRRMPLKKNEKVYVFYAKCPSETYSKNIALHHKHKYLESKNGMKGQDNLIYGKSAKQVQNKKYEPKLPTDIIKDNEEAHLKSKTIYGNMEVHTYKKRDEPTYDPRLPDDVLEFKSEKSKHQTQKPITLTDFILKYYSNEGDTILDPTMGSGTMGISCKKTKRNFIGCELDTEIFKNAEDRINNFKG